MNYLKEEIRSIPCFECINGMLEMVDVVFNDSAKVKTLCPNCDHKNIMYLDLKFLR